MTQQRELPSVSVCTSGTCKALLLGERLDLEFPSTGIQKIVVKLNNGEQRVEQNLFVEVK